MVLSGVAVLELHSAADFEPRITTLQPRTAELERRVSEAELKPRVGKSEPRTAELSGRQ